MCPSVFIVKTATKMIKLRSLMTALVIFKAVTVDNLDGKILMALKSFKFAKFLLPNTRRLRISKLGTWILKKKSFNCQSYNDSHR